MWVFFAKYVKEDILLPGKFSSHKILGKYTKGGWGGTIYVLTMI